MTFQFYKTISASLFMSVLAFGCSSGGSSPEQGDSATALPVNASTPQSETCQEAGTCDDTVEDTQVSIDSTDTTDSNPEVPPTVAEDEPPETDSPISNTAEDTGTPSGAVLDQVTGDEEKLPPSTPQPAVDTPSDDTVTASESTKEADNPEAEALDNESELADDNDSPTQETTPTKPNDDACTSCSEKVQLTIVSAKFERDGEVLEGVIK